MIPKPARAAPVVALLVACLAQPQAQARTKATPAPTTLDLAVTGTASHAPDAMTATLEGSATDADPARAQAALNATMSKALHAARKMPAVTATTGSYSVQRISQRRNGADTKPWQATQRLSLRLAAAPDSPRAKAFLAMIGRLQTEGVLLQSLAGALSPAAARQTEAAAIENAVHRLRLRAGTLAKALGDTPGRIRHVALDVATPVRPMFRVMAAAAAPVAAPGDVSERASLRATIDLAPPPPKPR